MTKHINSNVSIKDFFNYHCTDENAVRFYEQLAADISHGDSREYLQARNIEVLEEQINYAQRLLDKLVFIIGSYDNKAGAVKLKASLNDAISESMFER